MQSAATPEPQPPAPGPWADKQTGFKAELVRVDGDVVWYTIPEFRFECSCSTEVWLESMRPAA